MNNLVSPKATLTGINETCITSLEQLVANTCFCKLKRVCPDKSSPECMKHRNIYQEFNQSRMSA